MILRPSNSHTWTQCHGQPQMTQRGPVLPDDDNPVTLEGIAAHAVAGQILVTGEAVDVGYLHTETGVRVDDEMLDGVGLYAETVKAWGIGPGCLRVECPITIDTIAAGYGGTPDAFGWNLDKRQIYIADFKYGFSFVEVFENPQLLSYASGVWDYVQGRTDATMHDLEWSFIFQIVQPRSFHRDGPVREWRVRASDLRAPFNMLQNAAGAALGDNPTLTPGGWCKNCPVRHVCPALQGAAMRIIDTCAAALPSELDGVALSRELSNIEDAHALLSARMTGLEVQAMALLKRGDNVPSYTIDHPPGRLAWTDPDKVLVMAKLLGVDIAQPTKPITPTQAKKLIPSSLLDVYTKRNPGSAKLARLNPNAVRRLFSR